MYPHPDGKLSQPASWQVEELVKSKLEKPKTLRQLASRHWAEIERGTLLFDRQDREAAALRQLTKQDVATFAQVRDGFMTFSVRRFGAEVRHSLAYFRDGGFWLDLPGRA